MQSTVTAIIDDLSSVIFGKKQQIKLALTCLFSEGHLLIEDLPGMGKTTLSHALAAVLGLSYQRIQFTSDLLPADILGTNVFNANEHTFTFHKGPIFSQVVLADEINRAGPKTQSALLEAMEEQQVTVDGTKYTLPNPFFVIATQNPLYQSGTYPLPESQLDRFLMRISLGFPPKEAEKQLILNIKPRDYSQLPQRIDAKQLQQIQTLINQIVISSPVIDYIIELVTHTRQSAAFAGSLSPRASMALAKAAKSWAFIEGREFVTPDDVQAVFASVCQHRLGLHNESGEAQVNEILKTVAVPV
ncbi:MULTISPECIES: AAA family ATPase [Pseudoalteromonas]|jgi:MoxR-like ATPase|uniref:AAA family ATPase n=1 Tax=Pseudoalteromonas TaxID=53246 RepID=UPI0003FDFF31|nr:MULTISPECIES: MoxR family ATPase [Pseudoalteromonas]MDY6889036.1 MoxR family ATPase [Pseudomonadota bacterium]AZN32715.1 MoxR family ATPase [Pseudoalteromonas sp. Xi13]MCQ8884099.1 MoxR family ATPase [Pseudoalteromonas agarivorans]MCW1717477.1 MoxR family ATPase [Pseudoalteromonas sp. A3]MDC9498947.1 MoxR family ATPase [Pseudoalteromonas sp. Angola-20]|tara:strand:+ start:644 stop:1549 length:906 start_codon:yes stop_codon:yes gene_type:complete